MKCIAFIATSLDGYIARPDGNLEWLSNPDYALGDEDFGYAEHMGNIDALIMGKNTFEITSSFEEWPYPDKSVYVLSSHALPTSATTSKLAGVLSGDLTKILATVKNNGHRCLYIDGGITIQRFIQQNLLDEIIVTRLPILIGKGIPLFGELLEDIHLTHLTTTDYPNGFVQSHYTINHGTP